MRLNQSDPCEPSLAGRWHTTLVVDGSCKTSGKTASLLPFQVTCGFSNKKFESIGVLQTTETNSLANQT